MGRYLISSIGMCSSTWPAIAIISKSNFDSHAECKKLFIANVGVVIKTKQNIYLFRCSTNVRLFAALTYICLYMYLYSPLVHDDVHLKYFVDASQAFRLFQIVGDQRSTYLLYTMRHTFVIIRELPPPPPPLPLYLSPGFAEFDIVFLE